MLVVAPPRRRVDKARRGPVTSAPAQVKAVYAEAHRVEADMQRYLIRAIEELRDSVSAAELARLAALANPEEIYRAFKGGAEAVVVTLEQDVAGTVEAGGEIASAHLGGAALLDMGDPKLRAWLRDEAAKLVTAITDAQREAVRLTVERGVLRGRHPVRLARDIKKIVGLNKRQAAAVAKMQDMMEAAGRPAKVIDRAVERYSKRLLKQRARTIAHTESMAALNQGRFQLWTQLADQEALPAGTEHSWETGEDEMVCPFCFPLHRTTRPLGGEWSSTVGNRTLTAEMPPLHPQCRCTTALVMPRE